MDAFHLAGSTPLAPGRAHDGDGVVHAARLLERGSGALRFVDRAVVEPGASIGRHRHGDDEELYVVVTGTGEMTVGDEVRTVAPGDVIVNPPRGVHGLVNTGTTPLMIVVIDVLDPAGRPADPPDEAPDAAVTRAVGVAQPVEGSAKT